jgi:hypothetical protein
MTQFQSAGEASSSAQFTARRLGPIWRAPDHLQLNRTAYHDDHRPCHDSNGRSCKRPNFLPRGVRTGGGASAVGHPAYPRPLAVLRGGIARDRPGETIDHVGFRLENYWGLRNRLDERGIRYSLMDLPDINERRIFMWTPGGTLLEAVFDADQTSSGSGR